MYCIYMYQNCMRMCIYIYACIYIYTYTYTHMIYYIYTYTYIVYSVVSWPSRFLFDETSTVDRVCWEGYRQIKIQHYFYADLCICMYLLSPSNPISICQTIG